MVQFIEDIYDGIRTFMIGMKVTGAHLRDNLRPSPLTVTTIPYDGTLKEAQKVKVDRRYRGSLTVDIERCGGCKNCLRVCPVDCFWVETERTAAGKPRVSRFDVDMLRCMYCGLCVMACPSKCLTFNQEWGGATAAPAPGLPRRRPGESGEPAADCLVRKLGKGFYTPEEKLEVARKRLLAEEARRKAAAEGTTSVSG